MKNIIELSKIEKKYKSHVIFKNLSLEIEKNDFLGIVGKSGSGKTTLLNIIGLIDEINNGVIKFEDEQIKDISSKKCMILRRNKLGYLFQNFGLADDETVEWNLNLALEYKNLNKNERIEQISTIIKKFQLERISGKKIYQISGGEQQRVAIMRLILQDPDIIIADEPTSSLDEQNELIIMGYLKELHQKGKTIIMVTHNERLKPYFTRYINLSDLKNQ